jgi:hypothetical protein
MKKLFILLVLTSVLSACNTNQHTKNWNTGDSSAVDPQHETASEKLVLNNGAKWKVDSITKNNVKNLQAIVEEFKSGQDKSLKAYKKTGDDLQNALVKMISECKMKGPDHLALHKWLEPLMAQVTKLKQAPTAADAARIFEIIQLQATLYNQYFK